MSSPITDRKPAVLSAEVGTLWKGFFLMQKGRYVLTQFKGDQPTLLEREHLHRKQVAAVVVHDPVRDLVLLVRQFRGPAYVARRMLDMPTGNNGFILELPAGIVDSGSPTDTAEREVLEETDVTGIRIVAGPVPMMSSPGGSTEVVNLFVAEADDLSGVGGVHGLEEEGEQTLAMAVPRREAMAMLLSEGIPSMTAIVGLQLLEARIAASGALAV